MPMLLDDGRNYGVVVADVEHSLSIVQETLRVLWIAMEHPVYGVTASLEELQAREHYFRRNEQTLLSQLRVLNPTGLYRCAVRADPVDRPDKHTPLEGPVLRVEQTDKQKPFAWIAFLEFEDLDDEKSGP